MSCAALLTKHAESWTKAVSHIFLEECRDGTVKQNQFDTWLVQDYHFVIGFVPFAGSLLSKAPPEHFEVLLGGVGALQDEIRWFKGTAQDRCLTTQGPPTPTCQRYIQYMKNFSAQPYAVQALAFWAIERAYHEAWASHSPMKEPYHGFGQRWGSAAFGEYVKALERQADEALEGAPPAIRDEAEVAFLKTCQLEQEFWEMAYQSVANEQPCS